MMGGVSFTEGEQMSRKNVLAVLMVVMMIVGAGSVAAQSVGGGVSVWLPESSYLVDEGSLGVETALGTSFSMGDLLSLPLGVVINPVYALMPEIDGTVGDSPWFYADTISTFLMAQLRLPVGPIYFDAFGGVAGFWNATLRPLVKNIEQDIAAADHIYTFEGAPTITDGRFGWGWQAGGGIGVRIDQISVDLNVTYRLMRADATIGGTYADVDTAGPTATLGNDYEQAMKIRLGGFSIGINGSFAM